MQLLGNPDSSLKGEIGGAKPSVGLNRSRLEQSALLASSP
jgi:hypothetical protein